MSEQTPPKGKTTRRRSVNVWANDESETPNKGFNAALDLVREQQTSTAATSQEVEVPGRLQLAPHDEGENDDEKRFEELYRRSTFYIRKTNEPRLKKLVRKFKRGPQRRPKYDLLEEALEYLFEKYDIE